MKTEMKRNMILMLLLIFIMFLFSACGPTDVPNVQGQTAENEEKEEHGSLNEVHISASFGPVYALTAMVTAGIDDVYTTCLIQPQDMCVRSYQLSDHDIAIAAASDIVVLAGRGLESFEASMYALGESGPAVLTAIYNTALNSYSCLNGVTDSHWADPNPFVYMTVEGAQSMVRTITAELSLIDPEHNEQYNANMTASIEKMDALQTEIADIVKEIFGTKVIVMNEALCRAAEQMGLVIENCWNRESGSRLYGSDVDDCIEKLLTCDSRVILIEKQAPVRFVQQLEEAGFMVIKMNTMSTLTETEAVQGWYDAMLENAHAAEGIVSK